MERVRLVHGNGGRFSHELTERFILKYFTNDLLAPLHDGAQFPVTAGRMAFSTDSYVVQPAFFPGGNIGKLAVCGTVNDLAMNGAIPQYLSCGLILEEGLAFNELDEILHTMSETGVDIGPHRVKSGMDVILSGAIGDHSIAVMGQRFGLDLSDSLKTDCAPLNNMVHAVLDKVGPQVALLRDPTRGGLGTVLKEIADQSQVGIKVDEAAIPVHAEVQSVCDILGYDPLYLANEGKVVLVVDPSLFFVALKKVKKLY